MPKQLCSLERSLRLGFREGPGVGGSGVIVLTATRWAPVICQTLC